MRLFQKRVFRPVPLSGLLLLVTIIWGCAACVEPATLPPPSTPQTVRINLPSSLKPYEKSLWECKNSLPGMALFTDPLSPSMQNGSSIDAAISFGAPEYPSPYAFQIAMEQIVVVVNPSNPFYEISTITLQAIFAGRASQWGDISTPTNDYTMPVEVLDYAKDPELQRLFSNALFPDPIRLSTSLVLPGPQEMIKFVGEEPGAIGYLPQSWLDYSTNSGMVKILELEDELSKKLLQPVLAITFQKPTGYLELLIACLQQH